MKKGDRKKQQKALARRTAAKRERAERNRLKGGAGLAVRDAHTYPLLGCWTQSTWQENGLAVVVVARSQPDGRVAFGNYLADYYCLGVKNCFARGNVTRGVFLQEILPEQFPFGTPLAISADLAHELIYGSIEYAARWGFPPHPDFEEAQPILDEPNLHPQRGNVTFGKDGKPFYVSGPNDANPRAIVDQLVRVAGEGNFDYMVMVGDPTVELDEDDFEIIEDVPLVDVEEEKGLLQRLLRR